MTEKEHIRLLRSHGWSYGEIADELSMSRNTVKSYCRRLGLPTAATHEDVVFCRECGVLVPQRKGRKKKNFCSTHCRNTWWNHHRKGPREVECVHCHKHFMTYGKNRKYCSRECYIAERFSHEDER